MEPRVKSGKLIKIKFTLNKLTIISGYTNMNLLPKNKQEFSEKSYWDSFFEKRGNKAFEWYGEYPELCEQLHKYIKAKDNVLIVGCGNSTLGNDLYDVGYKKITSIDISQVAIRQMKNLNEKQRPEMRFIQMDALNTEFKDAEFTAILDKGTLDALMPDGAEETVTRITKYFEEMLRILSIGGRYVCISLLQEHILNILLKYFPAKNCMLRVVRCYEAEKSAEAAGESSMPVFIIICTKFKALPVKVLELNLGEKMVRIENEVELVKRVKETQQATFICSGLKKTTIGDGGEVSFEIFKDSQDVPRYTIYVVDVEKGRRFKTYAAFIVPQGRESEWLFATKEGRKELAKLSQCNRLAVVTLHREQTYESLDVIKDELGESVRNFAPSNLGDEKIQFLSLGADAGERTVRHKGSSKYSGDYVIEDVVVDGNKFRRLYYMSSQLVIQSEAKLKEGKSRSGVFKEMIDFTYLTCGHHFYMSRAVHMAVSKKPKASIAVIGLGGGGLCSFLRKFLPKTNVVAVDIDEDMLKVAKEWFGLHTDDESMRVEIKDGLQFLKDGSKEGKYEAVLFDVDSKDATIGMSCPPKDFLTEVALNDVIGCLNNTGIFIINVVLRDNTLRPKILQDLGAKFATVASYKLEQDLNEVFICTLEKVPEKKLMSQFNEATKDINAFFLRNGNKALVEDCDNGKGLLFHGVGK